jgi:hypothetical protein
MSKFVPGIEDSINVCNFKVVPEGMQQNYLATFLVSEYSLYDEVYCFHITNLVISKAIFKNMLNQLYIKE